MLISNWQKSTFRIAVAELIALMPYNSDIFFLAPETATGDVLYEKVFLEISQNSQKNSSARVSFLTKLQA